MDPRPDGTHWCVIKDADPRGFELYQRHYSAEKNAKSRKGHGKCFMGVGQKLVLLTADARAVFGWLRNTAERYDKQVGVICTLFRNEGPRTSSELVAEAVEMAWDRWPGERLFTYVNPGKVKSANPGYCFKKAGWKTCGKSKGGLVILERLPEVIA